jgi:hypothetical protein
MIPWPTRKFICIGILANRSESIPDLDTFRFWALACDRNMISVASFPIEKFFQVLILCIVYFSQANTA